MSYDLNFWKYKEGVLLAHQQTYERLSEGEWVDGLEELPIDRIIARIREVFADWKQPDDLTWESPQGSFQVFTTPQFVRFDCYGMEGEDMNEVIEVGLAFGCPLYDPQVGQRFDGG